MALDRFADADDVLIDDSSRADIQMSDFGVSHLSGRESDGLARRIERRPREVAIETIESRRLGLRDRVVFAIFAAAKSVDDDEDEKRARRHAPAKISDASAPECRMQNAKCRNRRAAFLAFCILHFAFASVSSRSPSRA